MNQYNGCKNTFYITNYEEKYDTEISAINICKNEVDGFIMVKQNPLEFHMRNRDGSIASMCGNGIRCFIHYCYENNIIKSKINIVKTLNGNYLTEIINTNPFLVKVRMVGPTFKYLDGKEYFDYPLIINNMHLRINLINTGVWHVVIITNNDNEFNEYINNIESIFNCDFFIKQHNINIVNLQNNHIKLKTYEYGVNDFTKACGTGSTATFIILKKLGLITSNEATIQQDGGNLIIGIDNEGYYMIGPSEKTKG